MLRCAPFVFPPFFSPRHHSRVPSLFRRSAPYKSSHPDQSVADLTRPRRFLMKASLTRSVAPLYSAARKCEPFICSSFLRSTPKLSLFHSFPLAGLCLPLNALSHIIPKCMRPPLFGLNSSATLSYESIAHSFRRSALFRCAEMRAVHLLLVSPLHSETIALSLISARGSLFAVECAFTYHTKMYETATFRT